MRGGIAVNQQFNVQNYNRQRILITTNRHIFTIFPESHRRDAYPQVYCISSVGAIPVDDEMEVHESKAELNSGDNQPSSTN